MTDEAHYWKTENGTVYFEAPDKGMTFDVSETHEIEEETFIVDESCECFLVSVDDEEGQEAGDTLFIARKGDKVLVLGLERDEDLNADIVYEQILNIKKAMH